MDAADFLIFMFNSGAFFFPFSSCKALSHNGSDVVACCLFQEPLRCMYSKQVLALVSRFKVVSGPLCTTVALLIAPVYSQRGSYSPAP